MKLLTIAANTFREGVRQPFYVLILVVVPGLILALYFLPFFTMGQDSPDEILMFKDVCLAFILSGMLVSALLLASKVIDEEIENRTMLTLMSKPVRRWELICGKFLGVMAAVTLALVLFAAALAVATWLRVPDELRISTMTTDEEQFAQLQAARHMHLLSLLPAYVLIWLQIAVMTSIAVAVSTRGGLVVNLVCGIGIYVVGHLTPFIAEAGATGWRRPLAATLTTVLPSLESFNLNSLIIYRQIVFGGASAGDGQVAYAQIWALVGQSGLYAAGYVAAALLIALALFRTRELG